ESVLVAVLADFGVDSVPCLDGLTGVWVDGEKVAAIGVRVAGGRTRHGLALNGDPHPPMFSPIVPWCIPGRGVTSLAQLLGRAPEMREVVDRVVARFVEAFGHGEVERQDAVWRETAADLSAFTRDAIAGVATEERPQGQPVRLLGRLAEAGV